ncbi:MAG: hypothetical protein GY762_14315 [Proteobacteria bacterium]|nr:hypothetical protein [Pseudomonadota bacterium]
MKPSSHIIRRGGENLEVAQRVAAEAILQIDAEWVVFTGDYVEGDGYRYPIVEADFATGETWSAIADTSVDWEMWDWRREDS